MKDMNTAALLFAHAVEALAEIEGMKALNMERESLGNSMAYDDGSFEMVRSELEKHRRKLYPLHDIPEIP